MRIQLDRQRLLGSSYGLLLQLLAASRLSRLLLEVVSPDSDAEHFLGRAITVDSLLDGLAGARSAGLARMLLATTLSTRAVLASKLLHLERSTRLAAVALVTGYLDWLQAERLKISLVALLGG